MDLQRKFLPVVAIHLYVETVLPVLNYPHEFKELTLPKEKNEKTINSTGNKT